MLSHLCRLYLPINKKYNIIVRLFSNDLSLLFRPKQPYRVFNTWLGDPGKLILLEATLNVIKNDKLLENVNKTGTRLKNGLLALEKEYSHVINSVRGRGTFLAFSVINTAARNAILEALKQNGVQSGGCGDHSIRLRPALTFQEHHADIYLDRLRKVLRETK